MIDAITLQRLKYAAQAYVSDEMRSRAVDLDVLYEHRAHALVMRLRTDVMAHKVGFARAEVPCAGHVTVSPADLDQVLVELPRTWWQRLLRRPVRTRWLAVTGRAVTAEPTRLPVTGTATVGAEFFETFPESTVRFPPEFGAARQLIRYDDPTPLWRAP